MKTAIAAAVAGDNSGPVAKDNSRPVARDNSGPVAEDNSGPVVGDNSRPHQPAIPSKAYTARSWQIARRYSMYISYTSIKHITHASRLKSTFDNEHAEYHRRPSSQTFSVSGTWRHTLSTMLWILFKFNFWGPAAMLLGTSAGPRSRVLELWHDGILGEFNSSRVQIFGDKTFITKN